MKKIWVFILGIITGIILTILFAVIVSNSSKGGMSGLTMFEQPGDCVGKVSAEVFQVVAPDAALVNEVDKKYGVETYTGKTMLITNREGKTYYDDQIIKAPKCFRQIGIFKYQSRNGMDNTVPVVIAE
ncbi:MAG: hypothetical protein IIV74_00005 [Alphaproteobacteria bacterium]|nr:hypothetical protein [Alphaproteobacteria bacterium]